MIKKHLNIVEIYILITLKFKNILQTSKNYKINFTTDNMLLSI